MSASQSGSRRVIAERRSARRRSTQVSGVKPTRRNYHADGCQLRIDVAPLLYDPYLAYLIQSPERSEDAETLS